MICRADVSSHHSAEVCCSVCLSLAALCVELQQLQHLCILTGAVWGAVQGAVRGADLVWWQGCRQLNKGGSSQSVWMHS